MNCKDCKYFSEFKNTSECEKGICEFYPEFQMVDINTKCPYQIQKYNPTCKDCWRFDNDVACLTQKADSEFAQKCGGFVSKNKEQLIELLAQIVVSGEDTKENLRNLINKTLDDFHFFEE